jgi:hypothetical protein
MSVFTLHSDRQIDQDIQSDLDRIVSAINSCDATYDAIYLVGSFGRGEGAARFDGDRWRGVNDYDLFIISSDCKKIRPYLKKLSSDLAISLQIDFVDLGCMQRSIMPSLTPTMQNYDFKYGSLLIAGQDVLQEIPEFKPSDLPPYEFIRYLCNRSAGLLTAKLPEHAESPSYFANQLIKACIAVGDIAVYLSQEYHHSYRVRWKAFASLSSHDGLPFELSDEAVNAISIAYETKLNGPFSTLFSLDEELMRLMIAKAYCAIAARLTGIPIQSISEGERALFNHYQKGSRLRQRIRRRVSAYINRNINSVIDIYYLILFAQPFFYYHLNSSKLLCKSEYIRRFCLVPDALTLSWDALSVVKLWEQHCH